MKRRFKIVMDITGEGDRFEKSMMELKAEIHSGSAQRDMEEGEDGKVKCKMTFEELNKH